MLTPMTSEDKLALITNGEHGQPGSTALSAQSHVLGELQRLACAPGFIYALAHAAAADSFIKADATSNPHERLSVKELTLTAGLTAIQAIDTTRIPNEGTLATQVGQLYSLLKKLHEVVGQPMTEGTMSRVEARMSANSNQTDMPIASPSGPEMVEPFFYVGTGAYDFQYLGLAGEKYRYDSGWLASNVGLSMDLLVSSARELQKLRELRFLGYLQEQTHEGRCRAALASFSFTRNDLSLLTNSEFEAFMDKFAVTPGGMKHRLDGVGSVNELEFKPIMRLAEDDFFMPVGFMLAKAIYESPFYWMVNDEHYANQASSNRGKATEEIAYRSLSPVFGDRVYRNVAVTDGKETVHEIDALAFVGNRALVLQAKSKRLTALARQGDDGQIKKDFVLAVQEAYEQGLVSRQLLLGGEHVFLDREGNSLNLPDSLEDVYVVCLTLDHFPALPHMTERLLEKKSDEPYPVAMSILDLDILATYLEDPLDFMHYVYQRSRWSGRIHGSCEVSFLGWYLNQGLALPQVVSGVLLTESMAGLIDADFPTRRGRNQLLGELLGIDFSNAGDGSLRNRWQNSELHQFISLLEKSPDPGAIDAAFMLLDLSQDVASYFREKIVEAMHECKRTGDICGCCIVLENGSGISYVWISESATRLQDVLHKHATAYKYKHKSDRWLGLGGALVGSDIALVFSREPWQADAELDELARMLLHPEARVGKPSRNQLCWCGSGHKYKKCHL